MVHPRAVLLLHIATGQAAFAILHAVAVVPVPPLIPLHPQVEFCPQLLATLDTEVPAEQAYCTLLLQIPSTLLFALHALAAVLVPQFGLLHPQVHGPLPLTAVAFPVAHVAVGSV